MAFSLGEYQEIFLEEADEQLQELNQNLLELEKNPEDLDIINNIFRAAHSLKSSAAFVGLNDLSDLAHKMENLLQGIRDRTIGVNDEVVDIIFKCFDEINNVIDTVAAGEEPTQDLNWLIQDIQTIYEDATSSGEKSAGKKQVSSVPEEVDVPKTVLEASDSKQIKEGLDSGNSCSEIVVFIDETAQMKWIKAQLILSNLSKIGTIIKTIPSSEYLNDDEMNNVFKIIFLTDNSIEDIKKGCDVDLIYRIDVRSIDLTKKDNKTVLKFGDKEVYLTSDKEKIETAVIEPETFDEPAGVTQEPDDVLSDDYDDEIDLIADGDQDDKGAIDKIEQEKRKMAVLKTVKVSIDKLDLLLNNVGELVIANSGFYKLYEEIRKTTDEKTITNEFKNRMEQMSRIAKDLQTGIMKTRMVQIGQVFNRFNRLVRDLSKEFNKKVELIIKGEETELDKKVIDSIGEPLMHLIRNAIDHGVEALDERKKLGKSDLAKITLNAYQGGNQIIVEVSDDGKGLNPELIKKKAIQRGLATPEMVSAMDNADIFNFIFSPGFSTTDVITDISGRGVGMNVVKETVNELNGSVSIETENGMGTRFVLSFPLTLAIIPAIMTKVQKEMFAIPLSDVIETIKISQHDITTIEGHEVINLRGEILSLLRMSNFVGLRNIFDENKKIPVVVVGFGNRKIGLIVDLLEGKQEIVIKSLEQNYKTVEGLAGASILGDGSICLILDVSSMINKVILDQDKLSRYDGTAIAEVGESDFESVEVEEKVTKPVAERVETEIKKAETKVAEPAIKEEKKVETKVESSLLDGEDIKIEVEKRSDSDATEIKTKTDTEELKDDEAIKDQVNAVLDDFRSELRKSVEDTMDSGSPSDHMMNSLNLSKEDLSEFQVLANIGATNAAESLSKIITKQIDLTIPEVTVQPTEKIPKYLGAVDSIYIGVMLPIVGDIKGTVLLILNEGIGFELIDLLYGATTDKTKEINEDGESALKEITNIIGSSVINVFAEKANIVIKPGLPTIVHDYMQSVIDSILVMHTIVNDYAVVMDTSFFLDGDTILGHLLYMPEAESLKTIINNLRLNVGSN